MRSFKPADRIQVLIQLRDYLDLFESESNSHLISYLKTCPNTNIEHSSQLKIISAALNISSSRISNLAKDLYEKCIASFEEKQTLSVRKHRVIVSIHGKARENRQSDTFINDVKALLFQLELTNIPRLGESISLDFIDPHFHNYSGCVHSIYHNISADMQETILLIDPDENFYFHWRKLKEENSKTDLWHRDMDRPLPTVK